MLDRANAQPEHEFWIGDYLDRLASPERVAAGRVLLARHAPLLGAIESAYRVDRHVIAAIWGIESNFGTDMGERNVVRALAMLAWKGGKRSAYGRQQLIAALQILERGDIDAARMKGSWAGAMGHTQFIPTTYRAHAVDFDKDGRRDIWGTVDDALASTANYLRVSHWRPGLPWGFEVTVPAGFDFALVDHVLPMADWARRGLTRPADASRAAALEVSSPDWAATGATLLLPAGADGPAFLVTGNFAAILRYNNASAYALAVGHLADRLAGGAVFVRPWPRDVRPLRRREREELQTLLAASGFYHGEVDGVFGDQTKLALKAWQRHVGVVPDAYPSQRALGLLKSEIRP